MSLLDQLSTLTTVVADTGDVQAIRRLKPRDATTNPSLITAAARDTANDALIERALVQAGAEGLTGDAQIERAIDRLSVELGTAILAMIAGRVSTEVDAKLSYDTQATIDKAHDLMALYAQAGVGADRVLIKIASTWEGIQAARTLEQEGIHCNLTLLFSLHQAMACGDAGVTLISPFVGRITDWHKKHDGIDHYAAADDPGVQSVRQIYDHYKTRGIATEVMGASFRSADQIKALAGCDLLTIAPRFLDELAGQAGVLERALGAESPERAVWQPIGEADFRAQHAANPMASELLARGIQDFEAAREQLALQLHARLEAIQ